MPPEAEGIGQGNIDVQVLLGVAHNDIHVDLRLRVIEIYAGVDLACKIIQQVATLWRRIYFCE